MIFLSLGFRVVKDFFNGFRGGKGDGRRLQGPSFLLSLSFFSFFSLFLLSSLGKWLKWGRNGSLCHGLGVFGSRVRGVGVWKECRDGLKCVREHHDGLGDVDSSIGTPQASLEPLDKSNFRFEYEISFVI